MWSDDTTMWVIDFDPQEASTHISSTDGTRQETKEFDLHSDNDSPTGIWSDDTTMWVADNGDDKVYAYLPVGMWSRQPVRRLRPRLGQR